MRYLLVLESREPISYGEISVGFKTLIKRIPIYLPQEGRLVNIPVVLGNSIRGLLRDGMAEIFLEKLKLHLKSEIQFNAESLLVLFSGGTLRTIPELQIPEAQMIFNLKPVMDAITPLGIMGFALGPVMIPSKLRTSVFYPVCADSSELIGDLVAEVQDQQLRSKLQNSMKINIQDLILPEVQLMRKDDTSKIVQYAQSLGIKLESPPQLSAQGGQEEAPAIQMLFYREALAPGTIFIGKLDELIPLNDHERGLVLSCLERLSCIGGSISRGFGEAKMSLICGISDEQKRSYIQALEKHIEEKSEEIARYLSQDPSSWLRGK